MELSQIIRREVSHSPSKGHTFRGDGYGPTFTTINVRLFWTRVLLRASPIDLRSPVNKLDIWTTYGGLSIRYYF